MKKIKPNYFIIPAITITVALLGGYFTSQGVGSWYEGLTKPEWTPSGSFISGMWTFLYILVTGIALAYWNKYKNSKNFKLVIGLFVANALLNATWSLFFFTLGWTGYSLIHITLLNLTILGLIFLIWPSSKFLSLSLLPYTGWVSVATALNYFIWTLN